MDIRTFVQSKTFTGMLYGIGIVVLALCIFQAGVFVGFRKAQFSEGFGNTYYRAFGGHDAQGGAFFTEDISGGHGVAGSILKVSLPTMVVEDRDGTEKVVRIMSDTVIRRMRDSVTPEELHEHDFVVVLGAPNAQSQVEAKLIRLLPPPPDTFEQGVSSSTAGH